MDTNSRIGDYEILGELGRGGMGRVYRVRNVISDRIDAMKVLLPDLGGHGDLAARFLREIKLLAALHHPHIAALHTALEVNNQLIMIMEYVEGQSVADRLKSGAIPVADAITYIAQVLDALDYAHGRGVVHRDIKPANMMLTPHGVVKLMDFGIAHSEGQQALTATGATTGSLLYMSPEQVQGKETDARSDLYSLGISFYQMVTGQLPFQADSNFAVMVAHLQQAPKPPIELQPAVSPTLNQVILTAMAKDPGQRFQSAKQFQQALGSAQAALSAALREETVVLAAPPVANGPIAVAASGAPKAVGTPTLPIAVPATPQAGTVMQSPPPPVRSRTVHPGVYMAVGGLLAIAALAGSVMYSHSAAANPSSDEQKAAAQPATSSAQPAAAPGTVSAPPTSSAAVIPASAPPSGDPPSVPQQRAAVQTESVKPSVKPPVTPSAPAASQTPERVESAKPAEAAPAVDWNLLEDEIEQLASRAVAINGSLDRMKQQQARQGFNMRGDVAARQDSMNSNLTRARDAVKQKNGERAPRLKQAAIADIEFLENFLGREP